jgi:hypothetical protein
VFTKKQANDVRCAVRRALLLSAVAVAAGQTNLVSAQDTGAAPIDEVVVTGSRLVRSRDLVAASPVQTIDVGTAASPGSARSPTSTQARMRRSSLVR